MLTPCWRTPARASSRGAKQILHAIPAKIWKVWKRRSSKNAGKTALFCFATLNGVQLHKPLDAIVATPLYCCAYVNTALGTFHGHAGKFLFVTSFSRTPRTGHRAPEQESSALVRVQGLKARAGRHSVPQRTSACRPGAAYADWFAPSGRGDRSAPRRRPSGA
jgi:hypothetical protein